MTNKPYKKVRAKGFDGKMKTFQVKREGKRVTVKFPPLTGGKSGAFYYEVADGKITADEIKVGNKVCIEFTVKYIQKPHSKGSPNIYVLHVKNEHMIEKGLDFFCLGESSFKEVL